jgi:MOSC domain-containing protein YiiM
MTSPKIVAIHLNTGSRAPLVPVASVEARPGRGLEGDRSRRLKRAVLFMEQEGLERFGLAPGAVREQVTVRGMTLAGLAPASRLRLGTVVMEAGAMCAPCERMEELQPGLRAQLEGRRGRFFHVVEPGTFAVGDVITLLAPAPQERSPAA